MAIPLTDSIFAMLPETAGHLAGRLGEPPTAVTLGMKTAVEAILRALSARSHDAALMKEIINLTACSAESNAGDGDTPRGSGLARKLAGENLLRAIFGSDHSTLEATIAKASGLERASVGPVVRATAPLVLQAIGQRLQAGKMNAGALASLLSSTGNGFQSAPVESMRTRWAMAAVVVCFLGFLWLSGWAMQSVKGASPASPGSLDSAATISRRLPNGLTIDIPRDGPESRLLSFIESRAGKTIVIDLDRVEFHPGKATPESVSEDQLQDVAAILNAYPNLTVKIEADNSGLAEKAVALSPNRARAIIHELIDWGVLPSRLTSESIGDPRSTAANSTQGGPAQNRLVKLRIIAR